jgi:hypothetical protein
VQEKHSPARLTRLSDCRHGRMLYFSNDRYVGGSLDVYGDYCEDETQLFGQILRPGHVVVEAGANIGAHTVHLAQVVGAGRAGLRVRAAAADISTALRQSGAQ